jgi:hypothetical protein
MRAAYGIGLLAFLGLVLAGSAAASEHSCRVCSEVRGACRLDARLQLLECVTSCPAATDDREGWRECRRACAEAWKGVRAECNADRELCLPDCEAVDPSCFRVCAEDFRGCLRGQQGVKVVFTACRQECREANIGGLEACKSIPDLRDRWHCFVEAGGVVWECLRGCTEEAIPGVQACADGFKSCVSSCGESQPSP